MATMLETPSRIWRRIEAIEDEDMPSLPSLPPFEHSAILEESSNEPGQPDSEDQYDDDDESLSSPLQSTPASTQHTVTSTFRGSASTSSTARFAHSIASRSNRSTANNMTLSRALSSRRSQHDSFDIPSLPRIQPRTNHDTMATEGEEEGEEEEEESKSSVPEVYLPPEEEEEDEENELSMTDALQSVSRSSSPHFPNPVSRDETPKKNYDYSVSLKSEPKVNSFSCVKDHCSLLFSGITF